MRMITTFIAGLLLTASAIAGERHPIDPVTVIANVTIIDAKRGLRGPVDVVLRGERIEAVSPKAKHPDIITYPANTTAIDGTGKFLIPGLWDAHVHLTYDPLVDEDVFFSLAIAHGVTSLRDIGGHLDRLEAARLRAKSDRHAPNLFLSGPLIDGGQPVYDGHARGYPDLSVSAATPREAREVVDRLAEQGVDFIKAYEMLEPEVFQAIVERAGEHGLRVSAHVPLTVPAQDVASSGVSDLQHLRNFELACAGDRAELLAERNLALAAETDEKPASVRQKIQISQRESALMQQDEEVCDALARAMAENRVFQTPTLTVSTFFGYRLFARDSWRQTWAMMPTEVADRWMAGAQSLSKRPADPVHEAYTNWALGMTKRLHDAGTPIIAGTDAPIGYLTPGISLHEELAFLVRAGLTPLEAIEAATLTPARFLGLDVELGTIEPGMRADLVLLRANPIDHISNTRAIDLVVKDGLILDGAAIARLKQCHRANSEKPC